MQTFFNTTLAEKYKNNSQKIRVLTENWVDDEIFCPACGTNVSNYENNRPVADFYCPKCGEEYELKSKKETMGKKIVDGAYSTMIERLKSANNPNFFFLNYDPIKFEILNFVVIPKHFFVPSIIEKRKPLVESAQRAGWVGCNILMQNIPQSGKIFFIKDKLVQPKELVLTEWKKTLFLREEKELNTKGWLLDIMNCIETFRGREFLLDEVYKFETELGRKHPENCHIKDKIRQQLQILRDKNYLEFTGRGSYRLT
ncbi:MAG: DpnI domain-containing protein [Patescibacteria group bacterium]